MKRRTPQGSRSSNWHGPKNSNWITKGLMSKSYPYEIIDKIRGFEIWMHGRNGYENLAREIQTKREAIEFASVTDSSRKKRLNQRRRL